MGEDLRAKDEAALAEFKASLQDGVENARAAIPALAKSVSTMALLLKYDAAGGLEGSSPSDADESFRAPRGDTKSSGPLRQSDHQRYPLP